MLLHRTLSFTGNLLDEGTLTKVILHLNEKIAVVLEYLEDTKVTLMINCLM